MPARLGAMVNSAQLAAGGHRLYSQQAIDAINWLMARQQEVLSVSRAVELWRQIETQGRDPLRAATPTGATNVDKEIL